ncbi:MAG TPA: class I SAM-dependent methyltransferase [bacterium]|nr:class I SAM-dependent methyltransferase [bacterium]
MRPGSVLDVGTFYGDFLKSVLDADPDRVVFGTEINRTRRDLSNGRIGRRAVRIDFRNGALETFEDRSVDNVVCLEVIEHLPDDGFAVRELCRVARKRVLISVPFNETLREHLCIHCHRYTPENGHRRSYHHGSFQPLLPEGWVVREEVAFGHAVSRMLASRMPDRAWAERIIRVLDACLRRLSPAYNQWLFVVLDRG